MTMCYYDYDITTQEMADYHADMMEMAGKDYPTDEEMEAMAEEFGEN